MRGQERQMSSCVSFITMVSLLATTGSTKHPQSQSWATAALTATTFTPYWRWQPDSECKSFLYLSHFNLHLFLNLISVYNLKSAIYVFIVKL